MAVAATAEVPIRPDTTGFGTILRAQLEKIRVDDIGKKKGTDFGDRFAQGFIGSGIAATIGRVTGRVALIGAVAGPAAAAINGLAGAASSLAVGLGAGLVGAIAGASAGMATMGQVAATVGIGMSGVSDAVKANVKVWDALAAGVEPTEAQLRNVQIAMAKLTPNAKDLVLAIGEMRAGFKTLGPSIQDTLLAGWGDQLRNLSKSVLPTMNAALSVTAGQLNYAANQMLGFVTSAAGMARLNSIFSTNTIVITQLSNAMAPLIGLVLRLLDASGPLLVVLTGLVTKFITLANATMASWAGSGKLTTLTLSLSVAMRTLWDIIGNLAGALGNIFYASLGPGNRILDLIQQITQKFQEWTASAEGQNAIQSFMAQGVTFFQQLGPLIADIATAWKVLSTGADPAAFTDALRAILPPLTQILAQLSNPDTVRQFGESIAVMAQAFADMNAGGGLAAFVTTLANISEAMANIITSVPGGTQVIGALATTLGTLAAIKFVGGLGVGAVTEGWASLKLAVGGVQNAIKAADTAQTAFRVGMAGGALSQADGFWTNIGVGAGRATTAVKEFAASAMTNARVGLKLMAEGMRSAALQTAIYAEQMGKAVVAQAKMAVQTAIVTARMLAQKAVQLAIRVATMAWTAAQWLLNVALTANPIGLVILAIAALVAAIIIAYQKSETFRKIVDAAIRGVAIAFQWVWSVVSPILSVLWSLVKTVFSGIAQVVSFYWNYVTNLIQVGFRILKDIFTGNWSDLGKLFSDAWDKFKEIIAKAWDMAVQAVQTGIDAMLTFLGDLPGKIWNALAGLGRLLFGLGQDLIRGLWNGISSYYSWLFGQVASIGRWILDGLGNLAGMMIDAGVSVVTGLWQGIQSMGRWLYDRILGWVKENIPGPVLSALGISSPSKVMAAIGVDTGLGLAVGILSTADKVAAATESLISPLASIEPNFGATTAMSPYGYGAGLPPYEVNVYIGDQRINDMIDLRVEWADENTARTLIAGRVGR